MEVTLIYGYNVKEALQEFKIKCKKEIEKLTAMNIQNIVIVAKTLTLPDKKEN